MRSRMEKYSNNNSTNDNNTSRSRSAKNEHLYDELNNRIGYEEMIDLDTQTRIDLTSLADSKPTRGTYHQVKDYQPLVPPKKIEPVVKPMEEKEKVFDINSILEEARKNREEIDALEKKRNLSNEEYNVLSDLNKKYLSQKEQKKEEYEGLEELIDTITSKTLANEVKAKTEDKDLLSDLVATSIDMQVNSPSEYETKDITATTKSTVMDKSFYTRSMDLSEEDFDFGEDLNSSTGKKVFLIIIVIIILLVIIAVVGYFVLQKMGVELNISEFFK